MGNESYTKQDEMMRSLLQEGSESVPEGLWERIDSRLDAGEHLVVPKVHRPLWKRVVLTLGGIAAVLAAGSLLWLNAPEAPVAPGSLADIAVVPSASDASPVLAAALIPESDPEQTQKALPSRANVVHPATAPAEAPAATETSRSAASDTAAEQSKSAAEDRTAAEEKRAKDNSAAEDNSTPEEIMPAEENWTANAAEALRANTIGTGKNRKSERMSLHIGGLTGGNFPDGRKTFGPHHSVSQPKPVKTGVIDKGGAHNDLPLSVGIGFKYNFDKRWAISTGINYTLLGRRFNGTFSDSVAGTLTDTEIKNTQHYLGIPLEFYYSIIKSSHVDFYTKFGGMVELNVGNKYTLLDMDKRIWKERAEGVQCSVNIGLGVEFLLTRWLGLYIDPSLRYWIDNAQPASIRTEQPLSIDAALGLRFRF